VRKNCNGKLSAKSRQPVIDCGLARAIGDDATRKGMNREDHESKS